MAQSQSSGAGLFGFGLQSAKGTAVTDPTKHHYMPVLSANIGGDQRVAPLPQEVGGSLWQRGSYKQSVVVGGDVAFNLRPNAVGYLLYALAGSGSSSYGATGASGITGVTNDATHQVHRFAPNMNPGQQLPPLTLVRHLPNGPSEQFNDCFVRTFRMEVPANNVVNFSMGFAGITPVEIPTKTISDVSAQMDNSIVLSACVATAKLGTGNTYDNAPATRISIDLTNDLAMDEFVVGSYYLDDITLLSRTLTVSFDTFVKDPTLYRAVMRGSAGAGAPSNNGAGAGAWSSTITQAALSVLVRSVGNSASGTSPYQFRIYLPVMDFLTFPISVAGNNLVRATLAGQVTLAPGTNDTVGSTLTGADMTAIKTPYVMELVNDGLSTNYSTADQ